MSYIVKEVEKQVKQAINAAVSSAVEKGMFAAAPTADFKVEIPADRANGDFSANAAMIWARELRNAPRKIADSIMAEISLEGTYFARAEVAGPGFMNFYLDATYYAAILKDIADKGTQYGHSDYGKGKRALVEFV